MQLFCGKVGGIKLFELPSTDVEMGRISECCDPTKTGAHLEDRQKNGLSLEDLANGASRLHYAAAVLEVKYAKLQSLKIPVIVRLQHDDFKHFVVYRGQVGNRVFLADPLRGNICVPVVRFCEDWDGKILAVVARGRKPPEVTPLSVPPWQYVTSENEAARQAIVGAPLPPAWVALPRVAP